MKVTHVCVPKKALNSLLIAQWEVSVERWNEDVSRHKRRISEQAKMLRRLYKGKVARDA